MKYQHFLIHKLIGLLIKKGGRQKAFNYFTNLLVFLRKKKNKKALKILIKSVFNVKPSLFLRKKRMGSKIIYLPKILSSENQIKQGIFWLVHFSKKNKNDTGFQNNFINEVILSLDKKGLAVKEKEKIYHLLIDSRPYLYLIKFN